MYTGECISSGGSDLNSIFVGVLNRTEKMNLKDLRIYKKGSPMLKIVIITYALNLLDMLFTMSLSHKYGNDIEGNPIGKVLLKNRLLTAAVKVFAVGGSLFGLYMIRGITAVTVILWAFFGIYVLLTLYHLFIILYLKKHNL